MPVITRWRQLMQWALLVLITHQRVAPAVRLLQLSDPTVYASSSQDLAARLAEPAVHTIVVTNDIVLDPQDFLNVIHLQSNKTIAGSSTTHWWTLDLNFVRGQASIAAGVTVTFDRLIIKNSRYGAGTGIDFFGFSPGGTILLHQTVRDSVACAPVDLNKLKEWPVAQGYPPGYNRQIELLPNFCMGDMCWSNVIVLHTYAEEISSGGAEMSDQGGYVLARAESYRGCRYFVPADCIRLRGADACVVGYLRQALDQGGDTGSRSGLSRQARMFLMVGLPIISAAALGTVALGGFLWRRQRRQRRRSRLGAIARPPASSDDGLDMRQSNNMDVPASGSRLSQILSSQLPLASHTLTSRPASSVANDSVTLFTLERMAAPHQMQLMQLSTSPQLMPPSQPLQSYRRSGSLPRSTAMPGMPLSAPSHSSDPSEKAIFADLAREIAVEEKMAMGNRRVSMTDDAQSTQSHQIVGYDDQGVPFMIKTQGTPIGLGAFGKVYQAWYTDSSGSSRLVAAKCIDHPASKAAQVAVEVQLMVQLNHPNIVKALQYVNKTTIERFRRLVMQGSGRANLEALGSVTPGGTRGTSSSNSDSMQHESMQTWLVLEFCDIGSLYQAIRRGMHCAEDGSPNTDWILRRLLDIARALQYVHHQKVIHGDLKCRNVMLTSCMDDPYRCTAKVTDFGLSKAMLLGQSHCSTQTHGTVTHMPPELLLGGRLSPAVDVYAFGIIMWEVYHGHNPYSGMLYGQVVQKVVVQQWRPAFEETVPEGYARLARECWCEEWSLRPSFDQVVERLEGLMREPGPQHT